MSKLDVVGLRTGSASPSSRGPGHRPFTAVTGVRIPLDTPISQMASVRSPLVFEQAHHAARLFPTLLQKRDVHHKALLCKRKPTSSAFTVRGNSADFLLAL